MFRATVRYEENYIWIKPVCDFFEINYENQTRKIKNDPILANHSTKKSNSSMFGDNYPRVLVDKIGFIRLIQIINPNTVAPALQDKFREYQEYAIEYVFGSFKQEQQTKQRYARLKKLERLQKKIQAEIKKERKAIDDYIDTRLQLRMDFAERPEKLEPVD